MNISIKTKNIELNDDIRDFIDTKFANLEKFITKKEDQRVLVEVDIGKVTKHHRKGDIYKAEVNVSFDKDVHRVHEKADHLYTAIDKAKDELVRHLRRDKNKKKNLFRRGAAKVKRFIKFRRK